MVSTLVPRFCLSANKESARHGTDIPGVHFPTAAEWGKVLARTSKQKKRPTRLPGYFPFELCRSL